MACIQLLLHMQQAVLYGLAVLCKPCILLS